MTFIVHVPSKFIVWYVRFMRGKYTFRISEMAIYYCIAALTIGNFFKVRAM